MTLVCAILFSERLWATRSHFYRVPLSASSPNTYFFQIAKWKKKIFGWTKENESSAIDVRSHLQQLLFGDKLTIYLFPYFLPSSFFFFSFILFPLTSWAVWQLMDKTEGLADFFFLINCHNLIYKWANREIFSARKKLKTLNYYIDLHRAYFETLTVYSHCVTLASS
jgi:hypothetical protein